LRQLEKEVDELKGLLDSTNDRLAEFKRSDESRCRSSCVCSCDGVAEVDETFVGDLSVELEKKYLSGSS
jgi:hypothetical protein